MIQPPIINELQWRGLSVPYDGHSHIKTKCPACSDRRKKRDERCAKITITSDTSADLRCFHCRHEEEIRA